MNTDLDNLISLQHTLSGAPIVQDDVEFYSELLRRMIRLIEMHKTISAAKAKYKETDEAKQIFKDLKIGVYQVAHFQKMHREFLSVADEFIFFMLDGTAHCTFTDESSYQMDDLWNRRLKEEAILSSVPSLMVLDKAVIPVLVLKTLISIQRMPFDTIIMKSFDIFAVRYRDVIIGGKRRPHAQIARLYPLYCLNKGMTMEEVEKLAKSSDDVSLSRLQW